MKNQVNLPEKGQTKGQDEVSAEEAQAKVFYIDAEIKIKYIQGKVLTIIEASALNPMQCQAVKSLIKHVFSEELTKFYNYSHDHAMMLTESEMVDENGSMDQFYADNQPITDTEVQAVKRTVK